MNDATVGSIISMVFGVLVIGGVMFALFYMDYQNRRRYRNYMSQYAVDNAMKFEPGKSAMLAGGTYTNGNPEDVLYGNMPQSGNSFMLYRQYETRGHGRNQQKLYRTVVKVTTPDIATHMVVRSRVNVNTNSGGDLLAYDSKGQKINFEGNFSEFFDVYVAPGSEADVYTMMAPDAMEYIMSNFADYDIEIDGSDVYVYLYVFSEDSSKVVAMLPVIDELLRRLRLRAGDIRPSEFTDLPVARTAVDDAEQRKLIGRRPFYTYMFRAVVLFAIALAGMSSIFKDNPDAQNMIHLAISFTQIGFFVAMFIFLVYFFRHRDSSRKKYEEEKKRIDENKQ